MGYPESGVAVLDVSLSGATSPGFGNLASDVGGLVMWAADGDERAWHELVRRYSPLVSSIMRAHRLSNAEATEVNDAVWLRLDGHIGRIRQPDRVGAWLAAVARDECVRKLTGSA
jgi:DNA-directed RNA polymerase specialized sigma24 family protein